jgi:hypothetical protein
MSKNHADDEWGQLSGRDKRNVLIEETREVTRQVLTVVGILILFISATLVPAANRYYVMVHAPGSSIWGALGGFFACLIILGLLYAGWGTVLQGVTVRVVVLDGHRQSRINLTELGKRLREVYGARIAAVAMLFSWPVLLLINFTLTIGACAQSTHCT